jgi:hypothetical protein
MAKKPSQLCMLRSLGVTCAKESYRKLLSMKVYFVLSQELFIMSKKGDWPMLCTCEEFRCSSDYKGSRESRNKWNKIDYSNC